MLKDPNKEQLLADVKAWEELWKKMTGRKPNKNERLSYFLGRIDQQRHGLEGLMYWVRRAETQNGQRH